MLFGIELVPVAADAPAPAAWRALAALAPDWLAIAEPPGLDNAGSVARLRRATRVPLLPHLTTRNRTPHEVAERVGAWRGAGIARVLALRGDAITACDLSRDQRLRSGRELVQLLLALDPELEVWCAAYPETHPEAASSEADLHALTAKVAAGATGMVCQATLAAEPLLRFRDRVFAAGLDVPLLAGVLPVRDAAWFAAFCARCGIGVPAEVATALVELGGDPGALAAFGVAHAVALCERLRAEGVDGIELFAADDAVAAGAVSAALGRGAPPHPG